MSKIRGIGKGISVAILLAAFANSAMATSDLQLFVSGGTYDWQTQTWVTTSSSFELYVISANEPRNNVIVSMALASSDIPSVVSVSYGGISVDPYDWSYGYIGGDLFPDGLPPHEPLSFPTSHYEIHTGYYGIGEMVGDVQPGPDFWNPATNSGPANASGEIKSFHIETNAAYSFIHFDAYTLDEYGEIDIIAPFSHDVTAFGEGGGNIPENWEVGLNCLSNLESCLWGTISFFASAVPCLDALPSAITVPNLMCEALERQQNNDEIGSAVASILAATTTASVLAECSVVALPHGVVVSFISSLTGCVDALIIYELFEDCPFPDPHPYECFWEFVRITNPMLFGVYTGSPVNTRIIDEDGNELGFDEDNNIVNGLTEPAWIWESDNEKQLSLIINPRNSYMVFIEGTADASENDVFDLQLLTHMADGTYELALYNDIPTRPGAIANVLMHSSNPDYTLGIDLEGDDEYEDSMQPSNIIRLFPCGAQNIFGAVIGPEVGLLGVPVDLVDSEGELYSTTTTNDTGYYEFADVPNGNYTISISTPLSYLAETESQDITIAGLDLTADFNLTLIEITGEQRGLGFWKHQVHVYLSGRGHAQIPQEEFCGFLGNISTHFNNNPLNPITLYAIDQPATQTDSLEAAAALLSVQGNVPMVERAKQHLMALLLNVISLRLHQQTSVSEDGATASQAIIYFWSLITDGDDSNDELAKDIAEQINNNILVETGLIPLDTPNISYKAGLHVAIPTEFSISQNYPNPFNARTTIEYGLPEASHVTIKIYNLLGGMVEMLLDQDLPAGHHRIIWDARMQPSGIYFYKIQLGLYTVTKKLVLLK